MTTLNSIHPEGKLIGTLPSEWASLTALNSLRLNSTGCLTGNLPSDLASLTELTTFDLYFSKLTCNIPR